MSSMLNPFFLTGGRDDEGPGSELINTEFGTKDAGKFSSGFGPSTGNGRIVDKLFLRLSDNGSSASTSKRISDAASEESLAIEKESALGKLGRFSGVQEDVDLWLKVSSSRCEGSADEIIFLHDSRSEI